MPTGISPYYACLTRRYVQNADSKSLSKIAKDTGVPRAQLEAFGRTGNLDSSDVLKLWERLFKRMSFLQANAEMDAQNFEPLQSRRNKTQP